LCAAWIGVIEMMELSGRVAVVTGAGGGIGRALAVALADAGMSVVAADLDAEALRGTETLVAELDRPVLGIVTDVRDPEAVNALAIAAEEQFGSVDVVCSNAGVMRPGAVWEQPLEVWERVMDVNLMGAVNMANVFVPRMLVAGRDGRFVTTVGTTALFTSPFSPPGSYSVSKHALLAFSEILHHELRAIGAPIGVTVLCPSGVKSAIQGDPDAADGPTVRRPEIWAKVEGLYDFIRNGLEPSEVAAQTVAAVQAGKFWVFPHPDHVARAQHRAAYIVSGRDPTPPVLAGAMAPSSAPAEPRD
jgi:NAD(P)-dependent dehydrogenase (short-subunit alcohol dehydrogenase family)